VDCEERIIAYESNGESPRYLKRIAGPFGLYKQKGNDLGEKMRSAFELALKNGACSTVIIGSDSPTLPISYLNNAFKRLKKNDVVLGPSIDGGYYLIGLKKACSDIFKNIRWSSETVFEDTLKNIKGLKKTAAILNRWYDIDEPGDLIRLKLGLRTREDRSAAKWTRKFFEHEGTGVSVYGI
jgi:rSAM/selenodomain-associated transferase 1